MKKLIIKFTIAFTSIISSQSIEQIKQAKQMFEKSGLTEQQAKAIAKSRGYSESEINDAIKKSKEIDNNELKNDNIQLEKEIKSIDLGKTNNDVSTENENLSLEKELSIIDDQDLQLITKPKLNSEFYKNSNTYFGYDIFKRDPSLFQASSVGAVDPNYLIGPGDEVILMLWGETQFRQVITVDREGFVFIPEIGQVFVNGLNLELLESKLFRVMSQSYASLNPIGRNPTTFLDISLGNLRPLRIQVVGEVLQPGAYTVSPSATLFSALYYFKGPTYLGTLRDIRLIRNGEEISRIDFYDYLLTGKKVKDQKLQLDDVIFIPKRLKTVNISGEINRPGFYELKPDETLEDLISFAGELKVTAYLDRAQIDRVLPFDERERSGMDRVFVDVDLRKVIQSNEKFSLKENDKIQIFSVREVRQNVVTISGAVSRPGGYDLGDSLTLGDLIDKADGLLGSAYMDRADIIRIKSDFSEKLIKIDLKKVMNENSDYDILLYGSDKIQIYDKTEMIEKSYVSISGHVKNQGIYLLQDGMTLYDLIFKADGFLDEEFRSKAYLDRAEIVRTIVNTDKKKIIPFDLGLLLKKKGAAMMPLEVNDKVRIYSLEEIKGKARYVSIKGNVKKPGRYELYEENMTIYDLIFKAGGFEDIQHRLSTFLDRADLIRFKSDGINRLIIPFNLRDVLNKDEKSNFKLLPGDEINIYALDVFNSIKKVTIDGVVRNPGSYELKEGMTIKDLILEAGGVVENVFKYKIDVARLVKKNNTRNYSQNIELNMFNDYTIENLEYNLESSSGDIDILNRNEFFLEDYDYVSVRTDPYDKIQRKVYVEGEVFYPGVYIIQNPYEKITEIIERAGGLRPTAYAFSSQFIRDENNIRIDLEKIINKPSLELNIPVRNGDRIIIAKQPEVYNIIGEISSPGFYKYSKNIRLAEAIKNAGGLTQNAEKNDIFVTYPNGISKKYYPLRGNHKVLDGSIINVGVKEKDKEFDKTEYAKELTSILANLAQAISLIILARN